MRAAVAVMGEQGYEGASVRDMASRAGVSVAALYYHFPSKQDLLREYLEEAWEVLIARLDRRVRAVGDEPFAQLDEFVATLIATQLHDDYAKVASNVAMREHSRLAVPERSVVVKLRQRLHAKLDAIIRVCVPDGAMTARQSSETASAVIVLSTSLSRRLAADGRSMHQVIASVQAMTRALVRCDVPAAAGADAAAD